MEPRQLVTPLLQARVPLLKTFLDITQQSWCFSFSLRPYGRSASRAFDNQGYEVPLSTLFFLRSDFAVQDVIPHNANTFTFPLLRESILSPRITYKEHGAVLGFDIQRGIEQNYRVGLRASIPVKEIIMSRLPNEGNGTSELGGVSLRDVVGERTETINGISLKSFAYRLDFLSSLPFTCKDCPGNTIPLVNYSDPDFPPNNPITISNQDITEQQNTPVSALKSASGRLPSTTWAISQIEAQALPALNQSGSNIGNTQRGRFDSSINYTPLGQNTANQAMLFIVPSVNDDTTAAEARVIQLHVNELLACIGFESEDVFKKCGISFNSQRITGFGDLDTELYAGWFPADYTYLEGFIGVRWPTGKKNHTPQNVFRQPLGNNGHYEIKLGTQVLWQPCSWAALQGDVTGYFVNFSKECIATAFTNAVVKNIGIPVTASIKWNYYILHTDLIFTPQNWCWISGVVGYEFYHKSCDTINFCQKTAQDCLGVQQELSGRLLSQNTRVSSHKIRGEALIEPSSWLYFFGGASKVVSGSNVPKETEWYLGFTLYY